MEELIKKLRLQNSACLLNQRMDEVRVGEGGGGLFIAAQFTEASMRKQNIILKTKQSSFLGFCCTMIKRKQ
jgi:hypothetical protein